MIANLVSYFLSSKLQKEPIYEALQHQDGIHLPAPARVPERPLTVGDAFRRQVLVLTAEEPIAEAFGRVDRGRGAWPVIDRGGLRGMVSLARLEEAAGSLPASRLGDLVPDPGVNETLTEEAFPHVHADHPIDLAMERLAESGLPALPVVTRTNIRALEGTVSIPDILAAYRTHRAPLASPDNAIANGKVPFGLLAGVLTVLAGLAILTGVLNYFYRAQHSGQAHAYSVAGNQLVEKGRYDEAVEQYRKALSISHSTGDRFALGAALAKAGNLNEAATDLDEVVRDRPQDGPANLALARVLAQQGRIDDAARCYQRAAAGTWPENSSQGRAQARSELAEMLARAGRPRQ
jgi:CBS domain-containing protein